MNEAVRWMREAGYVVGNIDVTIVLQKPKLSGYHDAMVARLADLLGCDAGQVSSKAKTHEGVDAIGEGRAVSAHVAVLLTLA